MRDRKTWVNSDGVVYTVTNNVREVSRVKKGYWISVGSNFWNQKCSQRDIDSITAGMWPFGEYLKTNGYEWFRAETKSGQTWLLCRMDELDIEEEENEFGIVSP